MFSFGWIEIVIVFVVVVVVIGPNEIPNLLRQLKNISLMLRKTSRQFKKSLNELTEENDFVEIKKSINEISNLKKTINPSDVLKNEINTIKKDIKTSENEIDHINSKVIKSKK